jgi:hypothetical protein
VKRHPFDAVSFGFGAILLVLGLLVAGGEVARLPSEWLAPAVIIGLGILLLIAGWRSSRTSGRAAGEEA